MSAKDDDNGKPRARNSVRRALGIRDFQLISLIGRGKNGKVYLVKRKRGV